MTTKFTLTHFPRIKGKYNHRMKVSYISTLSGIIEKPEPLDCKCMAIDPFTGKDCHWDDELKLYGMAGIPESHAEIDPLSDDNLAKTISEQFHKLEMMIPPKLKNDTFDDFLKANGIPKSLDCIILVDKEHKEQFKELFKYPENQMNMLGHIQARFPQHEIQVLFLDAERLKFNRGLFSRCLIEMRTPDFKFLIASRFTKAFIDEQEEKHGK